jgi:flagellin-like protein
MRGKKGISAIVATVLIILITVAAVTILWTAVIPMIRDNLEFSELEGRVSILTAGGYTTYDEILDVATVQVKREADDGVMDNIKIIFYFNGDNIGTVVAAPESGQTKTYSFNISRLQKPDAVTVVPIFKIGQKEKEGDIGPKTIVSDGTFSGVIKDIYDLGEDQTSGDVPVLDNDVSCKSLLFEDSTLGDGIYAIDPDGDGGEDSFNVYCDMTTQGGGWTLVVNGYKGTVFFSSNSFWWTLGKHVSVLDSLTDTGKSKAYETVSLGELMLTTNNIPTSKIIANVDTSDSLLDLIGQLGNPWCNDGSDVWNNGHITYDSTLREGTYFKNDWIKIWHGGGNTVCTNMVVFSTLDDNLGDLSSSEGVIGSPGSYIGFYTDPSDYYGVWVR